MRIVTRNSVIASFSTTTCCSETQAPLMPWTVSAALVIPARAASAKLVGDDAVISITFATLILTSSLGMGCSYPDPPLVIAAAQAAGYTRTQAPSRFERATASQRTFSTCPSVKVGYSGSTDGPPRATSA